MCLDEDVKEHEQQYNEMLESLIELLKDTEENYEATEDPLQDERFDDDYGHIVKLIEKITGFLYSEIKELLP